MTIFMKGMGWFCGLFSLQVSLSLGFQLSNQTGKRVAEDINDTYLSSYTAWLCMSSGNSLLIL